MKTYTASRLSEGNKVFPIKISIDEIGITVNHPGLFSGQEKTIPFSRVSSVDVDSPMVGYSTITIQTTGEGRIEGHGFTKTEVVEMKELILDKI
ncbi:MAG: PH domain-containing protein [Ferruginibacter sp.]|nr:PH domain-containing protein [Ferruginibacter sp.]